MTEATSEEKKEVQEAPKTELAANNLSTGNIVSLVGSFLLVIGLFMPWASLGMLSASGFQKTQDAYILLVLGIAAGLLSFIGLSQKKNYSIFIAILGIVSLGFLVYLYILLSDNLAGRGAFGVSAQIGTGFYISGIGAFIILIGAALMAQKKKK